MPATHPAGFHQPLSSDAQAQPISIYFTFGKIYTLCNEQGPQDLGGKAATLFEGIAGKGKQKVEELLIP